MKYNEELFNLSCTLKFNEIKESESEFIMKMQEKVLKAIFKKLETQIKRTKKISGLSRITIDSKDKCYFELDQLIQYNHFDNIASEYCIYVVNKNNNPLYYELVWDYNRFFELFRNNKRRKKAIKEYCKENGHNFSKWKESFVSPDCSFSSFPAGFEPEYNWSRTCMRCGYVETFENKPYEIEEKEINDEIIKLQRRLDYLKNNKK